MVDQCRGVENCSRPPMGRRDLLRVEAAYPGADYAELCEDHVALAITRRCDKHVGWGADEERDSVDPSEDDKVFPVDDGSADLVWLRGMEERAGRRLLDGWDTHIVDAVIRDGRIRPMVVGAELGVPRSTVRRRVQRMRLAVAALRPMEEDRAWERMKTMVRTLADAPGGLSVRDYERVAALSRKRSRARRAVVGLPHGIKVERRGDRVIITGRGPLPAPLAAAVKTGAAERRSGSAPARQCRQCGRFVRRAHTGRPAKYCSVACRMRAYRSRRSA